MKKERKKSCTKIMSLEARKAVCKTFWSREGGCKNETKWKKKENKITKILVCTKVCGSINRPQPNTDDQQHVVKS